MKRNLKINRIIHIGSNDAIGRSISRAKIADVISHDDLDEINLQSYNTISISAFDPERKIKKSPPLFIQKLAQKGISSNAKIVYYSTCRAVESEREPRHKIYIENKLDDQILLEKIFKNLSILFIPIIIPFSSLDRSAFFEEMKSNLKKNKIVFHGSKESQWNFINSSEIPPLLLEPNNLEKQQCLLSRSNISAQKIANLLKQRYSGLQEHFGNKTTCYPKNKLLPVIYSREDTGKNINWLTSIMEKE